MTSCHAFRMASPYVHPTAIVEDGVELHEDVKIWHFCHVRKGAVLERGVSLGRDVYVDVGVRIGHHTRVQNGISIYQGVKIGPWCFIGPHVIFTNDQVPRVGAKSWKIVETHLRMGASIGAGCVIRCGVELGDFCLVGAGAIVTKSVPPHHLALGFPAKSEKMICFCGQTYRPEGTPVTELLLPCCEENLIPELLNDIKKTYLK